MTENEIYKIIFAYVREVIEEYKADWFIEKDIDAEYMNGLYGVLIQRLGFDIVSVDIVGTKTIAYKITITSFQNKLDDVEKKLDIALFLDGIKDAMKERFEIDKPVIDGVVESLNILTGGVSSVTDNSVSYKSDYEFIVKI